MTTDDIATLIRDRKIEEAEAALSGAGEADPHSAARQQQRALLLVAQGRQHEAIQALETALQKHPDDPETAFQLAYLNDLFGDEERAIELYTELADRTPAHVHALLNLAIIHEDLGDYATALKFARRVLVEHPNHARARLFAKDIESSMNMVYDESHERTREKRGALLDTQINDFELSVRSRNCLKKMNINTLGDLLRITEAELLEYKNFGETSLNEIKAMLSQKGLRLGQLREDGERPARSGSGRRGVPGVSPDLLGKPLSEIEFSGRSRKCLQRLGLATVGDLVNKTEPELLATKNFGQTSLNEVKGKLTELGLTLRKKPEA